MKKILLLGGTQFIGRNLVAQLLKTQNYDLTLFNRQKTGADLFPNIKKITGDRETDDVHQIRNQNWDYIIDLSCYFPDSLSKVLENISGELTKYIFISTCSVYDDESDQSILKNEDAAIYNCTKDQAIDRNNATYGNRKAACERLLQKSGLPHVILRPALVYGLYDHTDRFYYWLHHVKHKKRLLLPDHGERKFSITYVNDLVETIVHVLEKEHAFDVYNVISFPEASILQIISAAESILLVKRATVNAPPAFLHENGIQQWTDMPLWLDSDSFTFSNLRLENDLKIKFQSFSETVKEIVAHCNSLNWPEPNYGMSEAQRLSLMDRL
jgi:2'-hydroxyisoflavone reductase